ncbi:MAG: DsbA family protein, partial [Solirubrobacteraceae bacterium]
PPQSADDHVRGDASRPLVLFYADFTCPRCAVSHGRLTSACVHVAFRHMALRSKNERAVPVACAAEAAAAQGAFWPFADALYADPGHLDDPHLWARARALGLDVARLDVDRRRPETVARVRAHTRAALAAGATTTPTLFCGETPHFGVPDEEWLARLGYDGSSVFRRD